MTVSREGQEMTISDEALIAAARAAFEGCYPNGTWSLVRGNDRKRYLNRARAALKAAAPFIRAEALEEAVDAFPLETIVAPDNAVVWLAERARRMRSPTTTQSQQKQPALADPEELEKAGPHSAMAERGRRGGESSHRVGGHGDGGS
jgi:hypothetical protein